MKEHLCLVFSPIDTTFKDANSHFAPPLGLVALSNYVHAKLPDIRVSILDGSVTHDMESIQTFIEKERPDIVGQSVQLISYENAIKIAKVAHSVGALNIFGGHQATQLSEEIIDKQKGVVDYVAIGDGEEPILGLMEEKPLQEIPNLAYADSSGVVVTKKVSLDLKTIPDVDYCGIDFSPYQLLLKEATFTDSKPLTNYLRMYSHKGCANRGNSDGCVFCGRADQGVRFKTPKQFWNEIKKLVDVYGADYIFDVGDDLLFNHKWITEVSRTKPEIVGSYDLGIFGRANRINKDVVKSLKAIRVKDIVIGFESGDEEVLANTNKANTTPEININAARYLFEEDIDVCASFVLGLPGENRRSLANTVACAKQIVELSKELTGKPPREMVANLLEPSPGSPAYKTLKTMMPNKYKGQDTLSLEEMQRDYFRCYFGLESDLAYKTFRNMLQEAAREIHGLVHYADSQGWLDNELD